IDMRAPSRIQLRSCLGQENSGFHWQSKSGGVPTTPSTTNEYNGRVVPALDSQQEVKRCFAAPKSSCCCFERSFFCRSWQAGVRATRGSEPQRLVWFHTPRPL